jgi:hypothetical protein
MVTHLSQDELDRLAEISVRNAVSISAAEADTEALVEASERRRLDLMLAKAEMGTRPRAAGECARCV